MKKAILSLVIVMMCAGCASSARKKRAPLDLAVFHNNAGVQYLAQQDLERALWEFKTAAELDPLYAEARSNIGLVYKYQAQYGQALAYFNEAIRLDPKWPTPYNHVGTIYLAEKRFSLAIKSFQLAAKRPGRRRINSRTPGTIWVSPISNGPRRKRNRRRTGKTPFTH